MKKILNLIFLLMLVTSAFFAFSFNASAETEGIFDYYNESDYGYTMLAKCKDPVGKVVIPSEFGGSPVVTIHDGAFRDATELTAVVIPKSVTGIYATSFLGCINLKDVYYEGSVDDWNKIQIGFECEIDGGIRDIPLLDATIHFNGEENITAKKIGALEYIIENKKVTIMKCDKNLKGKIEIPEKIENYPVKSIGNHAFFNCIQAEEIVLPETIKDIGTSAFAYCENLKKINIPDSVTDIKSFAFIECRLLENIILPNTISEISMSLFMKSGLKNIVIPSSVKKISYRAFAWCENLESIKLNHGLETVEEGAFSYTAIKELIFPETIKKLENWTITYCENLEVIYFPETVEEIGINICEGCTNFKTVQYSGNQSEWTNLNIIRPNTVIDEAEKIFSYKLPKEENGEKFSITTALWIIIPIVIIALAVIILKKKKEDIN